MVDVYANGQLTRQCFDVKNTLMKRYLKREKPKKPCAFAKQEGSSSIF